MEAESNIKPQSIYTNIKKSSLFPGTIGEVVPTLGNTPIADVQPTIANGIISVRDINWSNPDIYRAGIVPICIENGYKWIGLGVSKFSANITTIGGSYETIDYDLLSTAVREFNEEVGDNMRSLIEEAVYNCYALYSDYSLSILLPISRRPHSFKETEELFDLIWVTPQQLRIMATNQTYALFQSKRLIEEYPSNRGNDAPATRAFVFSMDLKFLADGIANAVEDGKCFVRATSTEGFVRPRRITTVIIPKISTNIDEFMIDSTNYKAWGNTGLVITPDIIGLIRRDRTIYLLPHNEMSSIIDGLNRSHTKTHVSLTSDLSHPLLSRFGSQIRLASIESDMRRTRIPQMGFLTELKQFRNQSSNDRIINELNLIISYEAAIYEAIQQQGTLFNEKRGCFLKGMNMVNRILARHSSGMFYRKLKSLLTLSYTCRNPPSYTVINIMIDAGLLHQNRNSTDVYIP